MEHHIGFAKRSQCRAKRDRPGPRQRDRLCPSSQLFGTRKFCVAQIPKRFEGFGAGLFMQKLSPRVWVEVRLRKQTATQFAEFLHPGWIFRPELLLQSLRQGQAVPSGGDGKLQRWSSPFSVGKVVRCFLPAPAQEIPSSDGHIRYPHSGRDCAVLPRSAVRSRR